MCRARASPSGTCGERGEAGACLSTKPHAGAVPAASALHLSQRAEPPALPQAPPPTGLLIPSSGRCRLTPESSRRPAVAASLQVAEMKWSTARQEGGRSGLAIHRQGLAPQRRCCVSSCSLGACPVLSPSHPGTSRLPHSPVMSLPGIALLTSAPACVSTVEGGGTAKASRCVRQRTGHGARGQQAGSSTGFGPATSSAGEQGAAPTSEHGALGGLALLAAGRLHKALLEGLQLGNWLQARVRWRGLDAAHW